MPFKLLKKSRAKYDVMSKDLYVITISCLDGSNIDCTLSSESKGSECLENVCQRAGLNQSEFFGLKYYPKGSNSSDEMDMRFVDLERPLNRQLEKYASNTKVLYLRIMYYILSGVQLITDEQTRNYYFLQLKQDIVEGRIICDAKQGVILANYGRQAEYGNISDRHKSIDYLKSLLSFPKHLVEAGMLENLTEEVIRHEHEVHDVTQGAAEELYISLCQQLDGYGQETFMARNDEGMEVMLGISVSGVIVGKAGNHKFFPWREIVNVVNHKRTFSIECTNSNQNVSFTLSDAETGRYIWKLCVNQHTFFMNYEQNQTSQVNLNLFQNIPEHFNESREDLLASEEKMFYANSQLTIPNSSNTNLWTPSTESLLNTNPMMESRPSLQASVVDLPNPENSIHQSQWNQNPAGSNTSLINRAQSSSCVDLTNSNTLLNQQNSSSNINVSKERFLPKYRPAPSYEIAIKQKYRSQPDVNAQQQQQQSQQQTHLVTYENFNHPSNFNQIHQNYPDVTHIAHAGNKIIAANYLITPQYQANRLSSTSTPDLATHRGLRQNFNVSSPDLWHSYIPANTILYPSIIGTKQNLRHSHSFLPHATYENLNFLETANTNLNFRHIPNNFVYRTASAAAQQLADMEFYLHKKQLQPHQSLNALNLSSEPIYENVPLPTPTTSERKISIETPQPMVRGRTIGEQVTVSSTDGISTINIINNNVDQQMNGNENVKIGSLQKLYISRHDNNNGSASTSSLTMQERDVNLNHIQPSSMAAATFSSPFHIENNLQNNNKPRAQQVALNLSGTSSNYTINTTADTTDSGISTDGMSKKRHKFWNLLGKNKSSSVNKQQKSATLGREKDKKKDKKGEIGRESEERHRWSTGLPKLSPLPANVSKEKLCQLLDSKLNDSQLFIEFERIPKRKENAQYTCALLEENKNKNSDPTCLPMDENRVKLMPSRENRIGYVNASYVSSTVSHKQRFYITAQSPSNAMTANLFWQCVWEADVYLITQLSNDFIYVPPNSERCLEYGQYQVWREFSQETNRIITSKLRIYHTQSRRYRSVWHLSYDDFNEQNCPKDISQFLKFLEELNSVRLASISEVPAGHNQNPPVLFHCMSGERTGLTLVADLLLYTLDHNQDLDIPRVIGQLREQRDKIVPSLVQYKFIYSLLIHYLRQNRLI